MTEPFTGYTLDEATRESLRAASTATIATQLFKHGFRSRVIKSVLPSRPELKLVGVARTLRYIPAREDLDTLENWKQPSNPQRKIAEIIRPGEVLVIEARGVDLSGTIGAMLAIRMMKRGAAGIVSDGPFRDSDAIARLEWPTYGSGPNANTNLIAHHPEALDVAVGCGGVHVRPGDVVVGDADGVIVIPNHLVATIATAAAVQEREEAWIEQELLAGASIEGTYPMDSKTRERYELARKGQ